MKKEKKKITKRVKYYSNFMSLYEFLVDAQYSNADQDDSFTGQNEIEPALLEELVQKFNKLYISRRKGYLVQNHFQVQKLGMAFVYNKQTLSDTVMENHLLGKQTIACYPCSAYSTKWFLFDVDVALNDQNAILLAKRCTKKLINKLREYIPDDYIHCYRSGSKGYHVVIYLSDPFLRQRIEDFQKYIIASAGLHEVQNCKIELRPQITNEDKQGLTAKLPLGRNFLNQEYGSNFCCFVNLDTLEYKPSQYRYFMKIEQMERSAFNAVLEKVLSTSTAKYRPKQIAEKNKNNSIKESHSDNVFAFCNSHQITAHGQRHNMTFDLALELKTIYCLSQKETEEALLDWLENQKGRYGSTEAEAIKDTKFQAKYAFSKSYERRRRLVESIVLTDVDTAFFADIVNDRNKVGVMERNAMTVLVAMIRHAKLFLSDSFFISYDELMELTDLHRMAINPCLKRLESLGKIEVVKRVEFTKGIRHANTYRLRLDVDQEEVTDGYTIQYDSKINVLDILKHFYSGKHLKSILTRSLYNSTLE
jgi:hypothetical protein